MVCEPSGEVVRRRAKLAQRDGFEIRSHAEQAVGAASRADYGEKQKDPHRGQHPETCLGYAIDCCRRYISKEQAPKLRITLKSLAGTAVATDQNQRDQTHADP